VVNVQLLLIRHGQTIANVRGEVATLAPGPALTPLGEQQAAALPTALAHRAVDAIFVSSLRRTHLTAAPLTAARGLRPFELSGLREIEAGSLEDRSDVDAVEKYHAVFSAWASGEKGETMPGGPDGFAFFDRFDEAVRAILATGADTAVAISHGAAIRTWAGARSDNIDAGFIRANPLGNTGMVEVHGDFATGWTCRAWTSGPVGGENLVDRSAADPTGERLLTDA
jgi:broad specificity phosphatase PhoE